MNDNIVKIDKDGNLLAGGVAINLNKFINSLDTKISMHIGNKVPTKFKLGDFWYDPIDDIIAIARITGDMVTWVELPFGVVNSGKSGTSGGITIEQLDTAINSLSTDINNKINRLSNSLEDIKNELDKLVKQ